MTDFPAANYLTNVARQEGEMQTGFENWLAATKQLPGGLAETSLTIATGSITPTRFAHSVDTEGAGAADDLTNIDNTNLPDGALLLLHSVSAARVVTVKHAAGGTGQISLIDGADIVLDDPKIQILLKRNGTDWEEVRPIAPSTSGRKGVVELATTAEVAAGSDTSRAVTPSGLFASGNAVQQGRQTIWIPATALVPRTTNGPGSSTTESTTNKIMRRTLDFDPATNEYAQVSIMMPKSWNRSTLTAQFYWCGGSAGNVIWGIQGVAISNDDPIDAAFGSAQEVTDTLTSTGDVMVTAETGAITVGGSPAVADLIVFQVYRNAASASDTMTGSDARLLGVALFYNTNAKNDA